MNPFTSRVFSIARPPLESYRCSVAEGLAVESYASEAGAMRSRGALHRVSINRTPHGRYACRYDGGALQPCDRPAFTLEFQPAGRLFEVDGDGADYVSIFQDPRIFRTAGLSGTVADAPRLSARADAVTLHVALALAAAARDGGAIDPLTAEHLGTGLARCVIRLIGLRSLPERETTLDGRRLQRVIDFVEDGLARTDLTVEALARVAHASPSHFSRAFKQALGVAPHRFILERRVERARQLLVKGGTPLSQVAYATGFSSQAHFSTTFRKLTGATPKQFRQARTA